MFQLRLPELLTKYLLDIYQKKFEIFIKNLINVKLTQVGTTIGCLGISCHVEWAWSNPSIPKAKKSFTNISKAILSLNCTPPQKHTLYYTAFYLVLSVPPQWCRKGPKTT